MATISMQVFATFELTLYLGEILRFVCVVVIPKRYETGFQSFLADSRTAKGGRLYSNTSEPKLNHRQSRKVSFERISRMFFHPT